MSELAQQRPRPDPVRRLVLGAAAASLVALAVVGFVETTVLYPERCMSYPTADGVPTHPGQFCIRYVPALGRYELPPAGIPADVSRAHPTMSGSDNVRLAAGVLAFAVAFLGTWWLIGSIQRRPRRE
jgi:hypothetical protein